MNKRKVLITGPASSGKTTFVQSLADGDILETDEYTSEAIGKPRTTVALDYTTTLIDGEELHVYGTPGQRRFHYMWRMLAAGADALVLLVGADRPDYFDDAKDILDTILEEHAIPYAIGITHGDLAEDSLDAIREKVNALGPDARSITWVDARDKKAAHDLTGMLMRDVLPA